MPLKMAVAFKNVLSLYSVQTSPAKVPNPLLADTGHECLSVEASLDIFAQYYGQLSY
jgi:hypothetical protein